MILAYWEIGRHLRDEILKEQRATYGQEVTKKIFEKPTTTKRIKNAKNSNTSPRKWWGREQRVNNQDILQTF